LNKWLAVWTILNPAKPAAAENIKACYSIALPDDDCREGFFIA